MVRNGIGSLDGLAYSIENLRLRGKYGQNECFAQLWLHAKHEASLTPLSRGNVLDSNITRKPRRTPREAYTTGTCARAIKYALGGLE